MQTGGIDKKGVEITKRLNEKYSPILLAHKRQKDHGEAIGND